MMTIIQWHRQKIVQRQVKLFLINWAVAFPKMEMIIQTMQQTFHMFAKLKRGIAVSNTTGKVLMRRNAIFKDVDTILITFLENGRLGMYPNDSCMVKGDQYPEY